MRVLLTGVTGFIGGHLLPKLIEEGHEVTALHRYVTGRYVLGENVKSVFADITDYKAVLEVMRIVQPEIVINLAAISPVAYSYDHPQEVTAVNYLGVVNLAEACRLINPNIRHFIQAGTSEEYGNQPNYPIRETARINPNSPYAVAKAAATKYLMYMRDAYDFPVTVSRCFNTYGRKKNKHFVMERIVTQMIKKVDPIRLGDPSPIRDMMFREDHVDAYLKVVESSKSIGDIYNFCTGRGLTIEELVWICRDWTGYRGEVLWNTIPARPLDIMKLVGSPHKAKQDLGWTPKWSVERGVEWMVQYWRNQLK